MRLIGSIWLLGLAACASSVPHSVPRIVDGRVEDGPAVSPYAYEWFIEGEIEAVKGRHGEAAIAFENATAAPSADLLLITRLAEEYELSGESRRADRTMTVAHRSYPGSPRVAMAEGRIWRHRGETDAALDAFARASDDAPTWADPVVATAETLSARGHPRRAARVLIEYLEMAPEGEAALARHALVSLAHRTADVEILQRALTFEPGITEEARVARAAAFALRSGQPALAARLLEADLGSEGSVELWLRALEQSGNRRRAAEFLTSPQAARLAPVEDRADALLSLHEEASVLRLLAATERSPRVQHARGVAFLAEGDYVAAATTLADVPLGSASFEASRMALADCNTARARDGAAAEALSLVPHGSLAVRARLAEIYMEEDELQRGLRLFDPKRAPERGAVAWLFERAGRFDEAAAYYAAVKVSAGMDSRLRARASAEQLAASGNRLGAIAILEDWARVAPEDLHSRVRLVELLQAERRIDEASAYGQRTLPLVDDAILRTRLKELLSVPASASR